MITEIIYIAEIVLFIILVFMLISSLFFLIHPIWVSTNFRISDYRFYRLEIIFTYFIGLIKFFVIKTEKNSLFKVRVGVIEKQFIISGKILERKEKEKKDRDNKSQTQSHKEVETEYRKKSPDSSLLRSGSKYSESFEEMSRIEKATNIPKMKQEYQEYKPDTLSQDDQKKSKVIEGLDVIKTEKLSDIAAEEEKQEQDIVQTSKHQTDSKSNLDKDITFEKDDLQKEDKEYTQKIHEKEATEDVTLQSDADEITEDIKYSIKDALKKAKMRARSIIKTAKESYKKMKYMWSIIKPLLLRAVSYGKQTININKAKFLMIIGLGKPHLTGILSGILYSLFGVLNANFDQKYFIKPDFFSKRFSFKFSSDISFYPYKAFYGFLRLIFSKDFYTLLKIMYRYYFYGKFIY